MKARELICLLFIRMTFLSVQAAGKEKAKGNRFLTTVFYDDSYLKEFRGKLQPGMPPTDFIVGLVNSVSNINVPHLRYLYKLEIMNNTAMYFLYKH